MNLAPEPMHSDEAACHGMAARTALRLDGDLQLDGAWVLDRYLDPFVGLSAIGELLDRSWSRPMGQATATLGVRMAELLAARRWPEDLVVISVPSARETTDVLARVVGHVLERDVQRALVSRRGRRRSSPMRRFAVRSRLMSDHVLLVDDVVRSGETLRACAELLRASGAMGVWAVAAAFEPVQGSRHVVPIRVPVTATRRSSSMQDEVDALVPVTFDGRLLMRSAEDESPTGSVDPTPAADQHLVLDAEVELFDQELFDQVSDDQELMAAVAQAFEAVAGLEALRSIVNQHSSDETLSIDGLLADLLRAPVHSEDDDIDRGPVAVDDVTRDEPHEDDRNSSVDAQP